MCPDGRMAIFFAYALVELLVECHVPRWAHGYFFCLCASRVASRVPYAHGYALVELLVELSHVNTQPKNTQVHVKH